ncbi:hypothetical protein KP79_PYT04243 [Mizuhopecten yessoensis]|uniref:Uncharacterized protein n=1 Tax=Mizuhopecten yessoensis TaxID=6573 RepID=A0A210QRW7_MIZYE|nr:hypothetical protein KP79_PYT04243 [Mizuhopecten yessoensis]
MSRYDNNSGPLTLIHDPTPRSLDQNLNNPTSTVGNFRIKGFVNNNFVKPTIPRTIPNQGILTSADDPKLDLSPQRSNPQHSAPLSPPHHPPLPMEMNGYGNEGPAIDKPNGYGHAPTMNGHSHMMNGHGNGWAKERPSPRYNSQDHPLSYRSVNQHQGRHYSEDYESNQNIPIRNAHEKTQEQIRKETQQYIDRKEEERKFKADSQNRLREKQEDQRRTREMLEDHEPFGRPGAGAPNGSDNKKKKFIEEQFNARGEPARYQYEPPSGLSTSSFQFWDSFGRPGHGAPLKTDSGNLKAHLVGDVIIRFQDRYVRDIENHRRHDRPPEEKKRYLDDLKQQQQEKKSNRHLSSPSKPIGFNYMDYFGRSGPGSGAPMISESGHVKAQYQCKDPLIFFQNPDMAREQDQGLDGMPPFHSPGRNGMVTDRQRYDQVKENLGQLRRENEALERSSPDPLTHPDAYLKQKAETGHLSYRPLSKSVMGFGPTYGNFYKTAPDTNIRYDENPYDNLGKSGPARKPNREYLPAYDPFSKPGAGAPRQGVRGERVTQIQGLMDRSMQSYLGRQEEERMNEKIMQKKYREDLDVQVAQNTRKGNEQDRHKHESQRDYADIIDSYRARPRSKHHLPHSDISRARDGRVPVDFREAREYHEELDVGFSNNLAKKRLDRMKDYQESRRHIDKMSTYWGRYGGGNRKSEQHTHKGNLDNLINNEEKGKYYEMKSPWAPH